MSAQRNGTIDNKKIVIYSNHHMNKSIGLWLEIKCISEKWKNKMISLQITRKKSRIEILFWMRQPSIICIEKHMFKFNFPLLIEFIIINFVLPFFIFFSIAAVWKQCWQQKRIANENWVNSFLNQNLWICVQTQGFRVEEEWRNNRIHLNVWWKYSKTANH